MEGFIILQKQPPEVFYKKDGLKNFGKFSGTKYLYQSFFFNKIYICLINRGVKELES